MYKGMTLCNSKVTLRSCQASVKVNGIDYEFAVPVLGNYQIHKKDDEELLSKSSVYIITRFVSQLQKQFLSNVNFCKTWNQLTSIRSELATAVGYSGSGGQCWHSAMPRPWYRSTAGQLVYGTIQSNCKYCFAMVNMENQYCVNAKVVVTHAAVWAVYVDGKEYRSYHYKANKGDYGLYCQSCWAGLATDDEIDIPDGYHSVSVMVGRGCWEDSLSISYRGIYKEYHTNLEFYPEYTRLIDRQQEIPEGYFEDQESMEFEEIEFLNTELYYPIEFYVSKGDSNRPSKPDVSSFQHNGDLLCFRTVVEQMEVTGLPALYSDGYCFKLGTEYWQAITAGQQIRFCNDACVMVMYNAVSAQVDEIGESIDEWWKNWWRYDEGETHCWDKFLAWAYQRWDCRKVDYVWKCIVETLVILVLVTVGIWIPVAICKCCHNKKKQKELEKAT